MLRWLTVCNNHTDYGHQHSQASFSHWPKLGRASFDPRPSQRRPMVGAGGWAGWLVGAAGGWVRERVGG